MAYSTITDTELLPGKPGSSSLFTRLRDNAIAMITGLAGAPKILDAAFNTNSINGNKLVNDSVNATQLAADCISNSELIVVQNRVIGANLNIGASYVMPKGIFLVILPLAAVWIQYWNGSAWVNLVSGTTQRIFTLHSSGVNGSNWRLLNSSSTNQSYSIIRML